MLSVNPCQAYVSLKNRFDPNQLPSRKVANFLDAKLLPIWPVIPLFFMQYCKQNVRLNIFMHYLVLPNFPVNVQNSTCKHILLIKLEYIVDPDQMASSETICSGSTMSSKSDKLKFYPANLQHSI